MVPSSRGVGRRAGGAGDGVIRGAGAGRFAVRGAGGTVAKTVDESVSYVVLGDTMADGSPVECSASYQNAQRLGIKCLSEQEFFAML